MPAIHCVLALTLLAQQPPRQALSKDQRLADFHQFVSTFQKFYAMEELKLRTLKVALRDPESIQSTVNQIEKGEITDNQFAELMVKWAARLQDGHVTVSYPFNWSARLPFDVDFYDQSGDQPRNAVRVTAIDRKQLPEDQFPFQVGWELKSIDDQPVSAWIERFRPFVATSSSTATNRLAARMLTARYQDMLPGAQEAVAGQAKLGFENLNGVPQDPILVQWITAGEKERRFVPGAESTVAATGATAAGPIAAMPASRAKLINPQIKPFYAIPTWRDPAKDELFYNLTLLEDGSPARASSRGNRYGLVRIPTFALTPSTNEERDRRVQEFRNILVRMVQTEQVKALVIDLLENPGGSVWFCQELLRLVAGLERNVPQFKAPQFRIRASYSWLDAFDSYRTLLSGVDDKLQAQRGLIYTRLVEDPATPTDPIPLNVQASDTLKATQWPRTTPVYLLVDDLTLSAGDLFASVIQNQKLGTIIGVNTMGAGGTVGVQPAAFATEASITVTQSIMLSPMDGSDKFQEVEGVGAAPDCLLDLRTERNLRLLNQGETPDFLKGLLDIIQKKDGACVAPPPRPANP